MLSDDLITLRPLESRHLPQSRGWANDPILMQSMDRARPVSDIEHHEWFAQLHLDKNCVYFAVEMVADNRYIGNVWLWGIDWRHRKAEIRIIIGESDLLGQGIGTRMINLITDYAFQRLNLHKVYAYVLESNIRSRRAFEKSGFVNEGVLKQDRWADTGYLDVYVLAITAPD